jgi:NADPH-dependent F420 reductase
VGLIGASNIYQINVKEELMNVTIIGTGRMSRAISTRLLEADHHVSYVGHTPEKAEEIVKDMKQTVRGGGNTAVEKGKTFSGEVVILAIPYSAVKEVSEKYHDQLAERIVVDITNPVNYKTMQPATNGTSGAENIASLLPVTSRVVKAFNTIFANVLKNGEAGGLPLDIFIAGDDAQAKAIVSQLIESSGMRAIDTGPLMRARQLEAMGLLNIAMQPLRNTNFMSAFKVID